ncbi:MAG: ABC transporter permease [Nitrospirae bacterium]|nr:ABC transporter permease [Candidatus Troglogloeales bacterium]MBI3598544.1 ABC transporter permease [Candidatus Troglogloeales bacterium]
MKWRAVAINTFKEVMRDKIFYNLLIFALILIGGSILLATLTLGEQSKIIMDFGLASINLFGVLMAIFLGVSLVSKEIEKRTLYTVLSKPIGRTEFLLGKYAGLLLTLLVNTSIMIAGLYLTLMLNQFRWGLPVLSVEPRLVEAVFMIYLELCLMTAVALLFSTFTTTTLAAMFTLSTYLIGHISANLLAMSEKFAVRSTALLVKVIYYTLPNLSNFDIKGQVVHKVPIEPSYFLLTSAYAVLYITLLIGTAAFIFKRRDF